MLCCCFVLDIGLLFFTVFCVRYFSSHSELLIFMWLLWLAGSDGCGFLAALHRYTF